MQDKIPITKPSITQLEKDYVADAVSNGWGLKCYDYIYEFQNSFAKYICSEFALATSSCTGAIHLALLAMGIKAGDEVIVPESTWIASVEPILYIGAKPVFVDISKDNWCINPESIKNAITDKTKCIIAVHLYGNVCEMDEIMKIAKANNIKVLEDAAEGLGSEYKGLKCGSIADVGVFSFHGTKTMTTGEGGILVTNNKEIFEKAGILNDHGRNKKDPEHKLFWMRDYGYKYKMSNIQAALGCAQIKRIEDLVTKKRKVFSWYVSLLKNIESIKMNLQQEDVINSYWMPTIVIDNFTLSDRDDLILFLKYNNIDARPFFYPLSSLPMFKKNQRNHIAYEIGSKGINLPSFHDITFNEVSNVTNKIIKYLN